VIEVVVCLCASCDA